MQWSYDVYPAGEREISWEKGATRLLGLSSIYYRKITRFKIIHNGYILHLVLFLKPGSLPSLTLKTLAGAKCDYSCVLRIMVNLQFHYTNGASFIIFIIVSTWSTHMGTLYWRLSFVHNLVAMETFSILKVTPRSFRSCRSSGSQT
jgi:hypothetical protein